MRARSVRISAGASLLVGLFAAADARAQAAPDAPVDCAAAFNDAGTLRDAHRLRDARARYLTCAQPVCPSFVRLCVAAAQEVGAGIPSVVLLARDAAGGTVVDVSVTMDGQPLATSLTGTSLDVDPGKHAFTFTAPGFEVATRDIVVVEGKKDQAETITLQRLLAPAPPPTPLPAPPPGPAPASVPAPSSGALRASGLWIGGAGVLALGVGAAFGAVASVEWSHAKSDCVPGACGADSPAQNARSAAQTDATLSTVLVVAGGVAVVGGALLWLLAPRPAPSASDALHVTPWLGPAQAGLGVGGAF